LAKCRTIQNLASFADYFDQQWICGHFWRYQTYHSPTTYASTNNACEAFNARLKSFTGRKALDTVALLTKLRKIIKDESEQGLTVHIGANLPTTEIKRHAKLFLVANPMKSNDFNDPDTVDVVHLKEPISDSESCPVECDTLQFLDGQDSNTSAPQRIDEYERKEAARIYKNTCKWTMRKIVHDDIPVGGWPVTVSNARCPCKYFFKFGSCEHVVAALLFRQRALPDDRFSNAKFVHRRIKHKGKKRKPTRSTNPIEPTRIVGGRPPKGSRALCVEYILN